MQTDRPAWMTELKRQARPHQTGRPTPPMRRGLEVHKEVDADASVQYAADLAVLVADIDLKQADEVEARILDSMTANRITSKQAMRVLSALYRRITPGPGLSRIVSATGDAEPVDRWKVNQTKGASE